MSYWNCDDPDEHRREAESRNRYSSWPDAEMEHEARFDRHGCAAAYMDRWDEMERERRDRYEREGQERAEAARAERERIEAAEYEDYLAYRDEVQAHCDDIAAMSEQRDSDAERARLNDKAARNARFRRRKSKARRTRGWGAGR